MATIGTLLYTWLRGEFVGVDSLGNRYYRVKTRKGLRTEHRWVVYKGEPEASTVPAGWHAWLHHTTDEPLTAKAVTAPSWQKPHQPNLSGTAAAYRPPGHDLEGGQRPRATGDYEPWRPT